MPNHHSLLENFYLFKDWSAADLDAMSALSRVETFAPGDEIFSEGDRAVYLYIIKYGSVRIAHSDADVNVATLGTGSHFGEMPFLDAENRSATVKAIEKTEIISIAYDELRSYLEKHPVAAVQFYRALATFLCGRLRVTTTDLTFAREKNLRHF